jgi:predicted TIM-barrel fold metal-dependent hydrolase
MIFDFRVFVGQSFDGTQQATTELLRTMDLLNVEMALVCPLKPLSYNLDQANANLAASLKDHSGRLLGAARIDPWQPAAAESLRRGLEVHDLRALYLNPWEESFRADMEQLDSLMQIAEAQASPVLVASGYPWLSGALQVRKLAQRWPNVPVVMTNGGQINISGLGQADATLALRQTPNLYIDTAGVYRQDFIEETVEAFGAERVLFGSGAPYFDQRYEIKRVLLAKVSDAARQAMQGDNALRMLGLLAG